MTVTHARTDNVASKTLARIEGGSALKRKRNCCPQPQSSPIHEKGPCVESSSEGTNCRCMSTSGDFVRWESSSEGCNSRCTSLAAKALTTAANLIQTSITISIRFTLYSFFMVCAHCGSESHYTGDSKCAKYCTLCKERGIDQNEQTADSGCVARVRNIRTLSKRMYAHYMQRMRQCDSQKRYELRVS